MDTPRGRQAIASLRVGDTVLAEDPGTGKVEAEPVLAVIDDGVKPLLALDRSDSTLRVTTNHPEGVVGNAPMTRGVVRAPGGTVLSCDATVESRTRSKADPPL